MCLNKKLLIHIRTTSNNTFVLLSDSENNTLFKGSTGFIGLKGKKRSTPLGARALISSLVKKAYKLGFLEAYLRIHGIGKISDNCLKWITLEKIKVIHVQDVTPVPYNGCKKRKKRRV